MHTTFNNERLVYKAKNGEVLVVADTAQGRSFIAVTKDGFNTDYPVFDGKGTRWDNPEYFTKGFVSTASRMIPITCKACGHYLSPSTWTCQYCQ